MANEKEIIRDTSIFTIARYSAYFFTILTGLVIARVLGPASFGVYSALMLIVTYSQYSHFGLLFAMTKKVPFYSGKKEYSKIKETENIVFSGTMIIILFVSLILIILSFFIRNVSINTISSLRIIAVIIILQQTFYFYQSYLRAEKKFSMMGKILLVYSIAYFIFIILLIMKFSLNGVFFAMLLAYIVAILYLSKKDEFKLKIKFMPKKTVQLMKIGFPLLTMGIMTLFFISIDKIMIIKFMDKLQLGYYSFAVIVAGIVGFIPQSISKIMFPYLVEKYGEKEDNDNIKNYLFQPTLILSYLIPIVIGLVFITAPVAIYYILPKYLSTIIPFKILICAAFFTSIMFPSSNFLITINKEKKIILFQAISVILAIILNYIFIIKGYGIKGVAVATAISYLFYAMGIMIYSFNHYIHGFIDYLKFFTKIGIPFLYTIVILALSNLIPISGNLSRDILLTLLKLVIFIVFSLPLVWIVNKKTGVVKTFFDMVLLRFKKKS